MLSFATAMDQMTNNVVFNATVCLVGIFILLVHIVNVLLKKNRRKDENTLLNFLIFTAVHFAIYFTYTMIKIPYTNPSNEFTMGFYTVFYICNNVEVFLLFFYFMAYVEMSQKAKKSMQIVNISLFSVFVILDIVNIFTRMFFTAKEGVYVRAPTMVISQGYQFVMFAMIFVVAAINKKLNNREKVAFSLYCLLPLGAIVAQNLLPGYAIAYLSIIVAIEVLFFFVNVEKNILLAQEREKAKDAQIKMMLSQIQPHFIYNSLSSISTLITLDPEKAQKALDDFTEYLRSNLSSLTASERVPFEDELRHTKTYVALEQIRFGERVKVIYDIKVSDFEVPPLTIQPLVENAVKHGILKKVEGGTVRLSTYETEDRYVVEIKDDGVGFDSESVDFKSNKHVGLNNIRYRLAKMGSGEFETQSKPMEGTTVRVSFKKQ